MALEHKRRNISIRCGQEEYDLIHKAADVARMSMSDWMRRVCERAAAETISKGQASGIMDMYDMYSRRSHSHECVD